VNSGVLVKCVTELMFVDGENWQYVIQHDSVMKGGGGLASRQSKFDVRPMVKIRCHIKHTTEYSALF
jgi:hypothetical protein